MSRRIQEIYFHGFLLQVNPSAYVVRVRPADPESLLRKTIGVPDWVFQSTHAIWLTEGDGSQMIRAILGELIREQLKLFWESARAA